MEKAKTAFNTSIKLDPEQAEFYYNRSVLYSNLGKKELEKKDLEKTLELDSTFTSALNNLGYYYLAIEKEYKKALFYFTKLIDLKYNANAYFNRAQAYDYLKEYDKAIADINHIIAIEGEDKELLSYRAKLHILNGDDLKADKDLEKLKDL